MIGKLSWITRTLLAILGAFFLPTLRRIRLAVAAACCIIGSGLRIGLFTRPVTVRRRRRRLLPPIRAPGLTALAVANALMFVLLGMIGPLSARGQAVYVPGKRDINQAAAQRFDGPQPVGTGSNIYTGGRQQITAGAPTGYTYRVGHIIRYPCGFFQLLYSNTYKNGYGESPNTNQISVKCAIERPIGVIMPCYFPGGVRSATLDVGAYAWTSPVGYACAPVSGTVTNTSTPTTTNVATTLTLPTGITFIGDLLRFTSGALSGQELYITATSLDSSNLATLTTQAFTQAPAVGDKFTVYPVVYERVYVSVGTNNFFFPTGKVSGGGGASPPFEGRNNTGDFVDSAGNIATTGQGVYSAHGLYGQPKAGFIFSVDQTGDSISAGTGDPDSVGKLGFIQRAINNLYPYVNGAVSGERIISLEGIDGLLREAMATGCAVMITNMGHNDLNNSWTAAQIEAGILEVTKRYNQHGTKVYWCTLTPWTTSTNGWTTTGGQTQTSHEADRQAVNTWLRDSSAAGYIAQAGGSQYAGVIDDASAVEVNASNVLTPNGGFWKATASSDNGTSNNTPVANTTLTLNDPTKNWTVNQWVGYWVIIGTGTGAGTSSTGNSYGYIVSNTATQLVIQNPWQIATPDGTSTYFIVANGYSGDGIHPLTAAHIAMAGTINMAQIAGSVGLSRLFQQGNLFLPRRRYARTSPAIIEQINSLVDPLVNPLMGGYE